VYFAYTNRPHTHRYRYSDFITLLLVIELLDSKEYEYLDQITWETSTEILWGK